jgi:hypothetical protein
MYIGPILLFWVAILFTTVLSTVIYLVDEKNVRAGVAALIGLISALLPTSLPKTLEVTESVEAESYVHDNVALAVFENPINLNREMHRNFDKPVTIRRDTVVEWLGFAYYPERYEYTVIEDK